MATPLLSPPLYLLGDNPFFPSLAPRQPIPATLASRQAIHQPATVGLGVVKAVCAVLTRDWLMSLTFDPVLGHWSAQVRSASVPQQWHALGGDRTIWWVDHPGYLNGIAWLVDALTVGRQVGFTGEFRLRWQRFLQDLQQAAGAPPPYDALDLIHLGRPRLNGRPSPITEGMMSVTDALYYAAKARAAGVDLQRIAQQPDPAPLPSEPGGVARWLYDLTPHPAPARALPPISQAPSAPWPVGAPIAQPTTPRVPPHGTPGQGVPLFPPIGGGLVVAGPLEPDAVTDAVAVAALGVDEEQVDAAPGTGVAWPEGVDPGSPLGVVCRVVAAGRTALLVGPTGGGKSTLARQAARLMGAALVLMEGWPSLTDRELFGKITQTLTPEGQSLFTWVDGPLAQAWRAAARAAPGEQVVLLIDELARMDPLYVAPLMGALDQTLGRDLARLVGLDPALGATLDPEVWYRTLRLPTGEQLIAPVTRLAVVATANLGADYSAQAHQEFDPALLGRFEVHLDVDRLDRHTRQRILQEAGVPIRVAEVLVAAEDFTTQQTGHVGGLLRRPLNLRVCLNWAHEARARRAGGSAWGVALHAAADLTAVPFCCARDSAGALDRPAAEAFRDWLTQCLAGAHLPR